MIISITLATVLGLSVVVLLLLWILITKLPRFLEFKKRYNFSKTLPGPSIRQLIANAKEERILSWLKELRKQYGKVFCMWFGTDLTVFFCDPDDVQAILGNNQLLYKSNNYAMLKPWLGNGLLTNGGTEWRNRRKLLTPAFHFKILSAFKKPMEDNCDILISKLQDKLNVDSFDIYPYLTLYTMDVICETAMGVKKHAQINSQSEYVRAVKTMCHIAHKQSFSFWYRFAFIFNRSKLGIERKKALEILHRETLNMIHVRRRILEQEEIESNGNVEEFGIKRRLAFLDMLLLAQRSGSPITDNDIREEVDTFMFEGHDTTSSALGFIIYLLSQHSDVQQKAYNEIKANANEQQPNSMKYLEAVIKESLRLYPAVPFHSRMMMEDLFIDNILIPKGTAISILTYLVHRNPLIYPEPEEFRPERFLDNHNDMHPYAFVAFSAGPRNCIGQKFAMLELICTISKLLLNFEILPVKNFVPTPVAELVMKSSNGIQIKLRKRV